MPGERWIVQPVVDQRKVGRLAPVTVERGDDLPTGILDRPEDRQQLDGVGDKARVIKLPEVLALGMECGTMARVVAAVLTGVQEDTVGRGERIPGRTGLGDQQ